MHFNKSATESQMLWEGKMSLGWFSMGENVYLCSPSTCFFQNFFSVRTFVKLGNILEGEGIRTHAKLSAEVKYRLSTV